MRLTTLKIDKTKAPTDKEIKLPDGDGLYLAITTTNKRVFRYQYRSKVDNKVKTYTIGDYPTISLADARLKRNELKNGMCLKGVDPQQQKQKQKADNQLTLSVAVQEWYSHYTSIKQLAPNTLKNKVIQVACIVKYIGKVPLAQLNSDHLTAFIKALERNKQGYNTTRCIHTIKCVLKHYGKPTSCCDGLSYITVKDKSHAAITRENDLRQVMIGLNNLSTSLSPNTRYSLLILPHVYTRLNDLLSVKWSDLDLDNGVWYLKQAKTGDEILLPLSTQVIAMFKELRTINNGIYAFESTTTKTGYIDKSPLNKAFKTITATATLHGWRSTAMTVGQEVLSIPYHLLDLNLGHKPRGLDKAYNRALFIKERKVIAQQWSDYLYSLVND